MNEEELKNLYDEMKKVCDKQDFTYSCAYYSDSYECLIFSNGKFENLHYPLCNSCKNYLITHHVDYRCYIFEKLEDILEMNSNLF